MSGCIHDHIYMYSLAANMVAQDTREVSPMQWSCRWLGNLLASLRAEGRTYKGMNGKVRKFNGLVQANGTSEAHNEM